MEGKKLTKEKDLQEGKISSSRDESKPKLFSIQMELDLMQVAIFILTLTTRLYRLEQPRAIVFDELHYGRYASLYLKRTFFFDPHPPLGKMLFAASAYITGFDPNFNFDRIGSYYLPSLPVWGLRILPAFLGSCVVPLSYQILVEMDFSRWTACLASILILLDNALLTQSNYMLLEGMLLFFMAVAVLSLLKFLKCSTPFTLDWWKWLIMLSISSCASLSIKYIGFMTHVLCVSLICRQFWNMLADRSLTNRQLFRHLLARFSTLIVGVFGLYLAVFAVHLSILTKAGPHDDVMTSAFQASLDGGLAAITKGQPLTVAYGSQVTLRHTHGKPCWLHSHPQVYPLRYSDGRGSSHQQQVTCYTFKDVNNWWIIKHPDSTSLQVSDPVRPVRDGDVVQLIHGVTSRALNSHNVAAPVSPQLQEVSCYIDYNISVPAQNLWRVEVVNSAEGGATWNTINSQVRLVHVNSSQALKTSGRQLGDWGYHQYEVVTDKLVAQDAAVWNVEEHRYTRSTEHTEQDLARAPLLPLTHAQLGFLAKFSELQVKMLWSRPEAPLEHRYASAPIDWPLLTTNVAYWMDTTSNAQVHLLGNYVIWITGTASLAIYAILLVFYLLRRCRKCYDVDQETWDQFVFSGELMAGGYALHLLPYFLTEQTLFLHHYLPALYFKILLLSTVIEHVYRLLERSKVMKQVFLMVVLVWVYVVFHVFKLFLPFTYGHPVLDEDAIAVLTWKDTWDFIVKKRL